MARSFYLGDDVDVEFRGVTEQVDELFACEVSVAAGCWVVGKRAGAVCRVEHVFFIERVSAACAVFGQFRKSRYFQPPRFVVVEVEMEFVELVVRHLVENLLDGFLCLEIACDIEHESAVGEIGLVLYSDALQ